MCCWACAARDSSWGWTGVRRWQYREDGKVSGHRNLISSNVNRLGRKHPMLERTAVLFPDVCSVAPRESNNESSDVL